jgi:hypothetical protein
VLAAVLAEVEAVVEVFDLVDLDEDAWPFIDSFGISCSEKFTVMKSKS